MIRAEHLTRAFDSVIAVDDLSLEVPAGSIFGFLGPNGAGKTTTLHLLLGLLEPTAGRAEVLGHDTRTHADQIRQRCGVLLEHTGLYEQMTAEENLEFYGRVWHLGRTERRERIETLLRQIDVWERRRDRVKTWSRGMKQRLALARVMLHRPALVFLDEPTAGLDVMAAAAVRDELARLASDEGITIFLTTHNMTEAERLCDQVAVVHHGKLLAVDDPDRLRRDGGLRVEIVGRGFTEEMIDQIRALQDVAQATLLEGRLIIELTGEVEVAPLVSALVKAGAEVEEVTRGKASLEEVFMELIAEEGHSE